MCWERGNIVENEVRDIGDQNMQCFEAVIKDLGMYVCVCVGGVLGDTSKEKRINNQSVCLRRTELSFGRMV